MAKKSTASSARGGRAKKSAGVIRDSQIDFSDIPELTDEQLRQMRRPGRPLLGTSARQLIAIRIETDILKRLKSQAEADGKGYQTLINEILSKYVKKGRAA